MKKIRQGNAFYASASFFSFFPKINLANVSDKLASLFPLNIEQLEYKNITEAIPSISQKHQEVLCRENDATYDAYEPSTTEQAVAGDHL